MVRPRPVVTALAVAAALAGGAVAAAAPAGAEPIERQPYRIRLVLAVDPAARIDARGRDALVGRWTDLVRRFVGAPWRVEVAPEGQSAAAAGDLEALRPEQLAGEADGVDKVWAVRVGAAGSGLAFTGRELDVATGRLGGLQTRTAPAVRDAPRALLRFALDLFSPYAEVGERFGKDVSLTVRGAALSPASPSGRVVVEGEVFQPVRVVPARGEKPRVVRAIAYTYLRAEAVTETGARCALVSVYGDPLTGQVLQETALVALGVKPGKTPTRLRFVTLPDRAPAAGYVLTARRYPDGQPHEVGTTDRQGRVTLDPSHADGLLVFRLLAGSTEPMVEFPLMPGHDDAERTVPPFDPKPLAVALETRLDSLRDEVIDLVAVRARLEARLKARFDVEDWAGAESIVKEFRALPPRESFTDALTRLKDDAARRQAETHKPVLTKTAQARIADMEGLLARYLDDDVVKGYADALARMKNPPAEKEKPKAKEAAKAKAKPAARPPAP